MPNICTIFSQYLKYIHKSFAQYFFLKSSLFIFILVQKNQCLKKFLIILSQSDDECLNHSKYITDRTFLMIFLTSGNLFLFTFILGDLVCTMSKKNYCVSPIQIISPH